MTQTNLRMLSTPSEGGTTTVYAVLTGEDKGDGRFAVALRDAWNERAGLAANAAEIRRLADDVEAIQRGPDLSPDMVDPVWVGRCRRCGEILASFRDDRWSQGSDEDAEVFRQIGRTLVMGLLVERAPGPVTRGLCRCDPREAGGFLPPATMVRKTPLRVNLRKKSQRARMLR